MKRERGLIDLNARILKILLSNNRVKQIVRILENNFDSGSAEELAKVIIRTDIEFFMGLLGMLPTLINTQFLFFHSFLREMKRLPDELVNEFTITVYNKIDWSLMEKNLQDAKEFFPADILDKIAVNSAEILSSVLGSFILEYGKRKSFSAKFMKVFLDNMEKTINENPKFKKRINKILGIKNEK